MLYRDLRPAELFKQETFYTHPWLVTDGQDNPKVLFFAEKEPGMAIIE